MYVLLILFLSVKKTPTKQTKENALFVLVKLNYYLCDATQLLFLFIIEESLNSCL